MKKIILIGLVLLVFQISCITDKDKYKETDLYEEYEGENGFAVMHLPPVLFKIVISVSEDSTFNSKQLLDKIDVIKVMFFEEKENTVTLEDLKLSVNNKIKEYNYNLLTRIAQEDNDITIYIINNEDIIHEVLFNIVSDKNFISVNVVGNLTKEEVMEVYKAINTDNIMQYKN